ncbi:uncharacterized protein LOC131145581 [Malania oleifera]|uniref:uncharacterized protein LOC131145581 n=1 Tax=Malania oleifera TaxID=397392 RepID=UPI0025AE6517|nr:uncharacterized protein LOC131145581 [Malania oleifera]
MGNCQAIDTATLVIQHPCGKEEKLYWAVKASEIMKMNPGHYVALLITTSLCPPPQPAGGDCNKSGNINNSSSSNTNNLVRVTRVKILRPTDTLVLGQVYRLITAQEVMKGLWAKKQAKMKKNQQESESAVKRGRVKEKAGPGFGSAARRSEPAEKTTQVIKHGRHRPRTSSSSTSTANSTTVRGRTWQPSLQSISEASS